MKNKYTLQFILGLVLLLSLGSLFQNCSNSFQTVQNSSDLARGASAGFVSALNRDRGYADEVYIGYQGWFSTPDDGYNDNWFHWEEGGISHVDLLPDVSIYPDSVLKPAPFNNGYKLFSSTSAEVVDVHTELIAKAGIDGFAIQRFVDKDLENRNSLFLHKNRTAELIKASAEKWGTKFYLQYDTSGSPDNWVTAIKNDFNEVIKDHLKLLESPNYARQNGKIVVCLWGPGFTDRPGTAAEAAALIQWFKTEHDAFVIGGVPTNWRTSNSDSKPNWQNTYLSYDSIEPWSVGRFNNDASAQSFYSNYVAKDLKYLQEMNNLLKKNIQYKTIIWPGFSWHNMNRANGKSTPFNQVPRRGGQFLWKQAQLAATRGIKTYVAMFDEFDEGTAIAPAANSKSLIPPGTTFLTLDADGLQMSSDFYVRLTGEITQMLRTSSARSSFSTGLQGPVLRLDSRGSESPVIKSDFNLSWSFSGPDSTQPFCWAISEDADPHTWNDNFLCADKDLKLRWSPAGPIEGLYCTKVDEPSDPHTWSDNYLCSELDLKLQWSYAGPIPGLKCLLVNEPSDPDAWTDNFLCHPEN